MRHKYRKKGRAVYGPLFSSRANTHFASQIPNARHQILTIPCDIYRREQPAMEEEKRQDAALPPQCTFRCARLRKAAGRSG